MRGRPRILARPAAGAFREPCGEALVVQLDRDRKRPLEQRCELARLGRLGGVRARERERQADDDPVDVELGDKRAQPREATAGPGDSTASIGVASTPVGSLTAQPQRALP